MLPSIIDTIIFIEGGDIGNVLTVKMTVKVPTGFKDKDLARPVVEVRDFQNRRLVFEIYSFGQDVVLNPINPIKTQKTFTPTPRRGQKKGKIELDIDVQQNKLVIEAPYQYASTNIEIYADHNLIFTGALSRDSDINLSLSTREGKRILREFQRNKNIYGKAK
jgi:predicted PilT family ATPase